MVWFLWFSGFVVFWFSYAPVSNKFLLLSGRSAVDKVPSPFRSIVSNRFRTVLEGGFFQIP